MITIYKNRALQQAIREADKSAAIENQRYAVVIGYSENDDLCWSAIPMDDVRRNDEPVYFTEAVRS